MTHAVALPAPRRMGFLAALGLVAALGLGGLAAEPAQAQGAGTTGRGCMDQAWRDLNDCYMSGAGYWHDAGCEAAFFLDAASCAAEVKKSVQLL